MSLRNERELCHSFQQLPPELADSLSAFYHTYKQALGDAFPKVAPMLLAYIEEVKKMAIKPYSFSHFHQQEREPFDFYEMGRTVIRPLIDLEKSTLEGKEVLQELEEALQRKENVIFLANHQTEPDPQIISLMVEPYSKTLAEQTIYIAGHRVTKDPMAIPFSRGCNLICIYSKKHIEQAPEERSERLQHNARSLAHIEELLQKGGAAFYVAPSGGRDRWDETGRVQVAPFDPQSVEMFYLFSKRTSVPTHFHLLTLSTIDLLPPPKERHKALGEERRAARVPVHLHFSRELFLEQLASCESDRKQQRVERAERLTKQVEETYARFR